LEAREALAVKRRDTSAMSAEELRDAIRIKDGAKFDAAFKQFTLECNSCHERVGLRFIKIKGAGDVTDNDLTPKQ
jgi:hypothetical protein